MVSRNIIHNKFDIGGLLQRYSNWPKEKRRDDAEVALRSQYRISGGSPAIATCIRRGPDSPDRPLARQIAPREEQRPRGGAPRATLGSANAVLAVAGVALILMRQRRGRDQL